MHCRNAYGNHTYYGELSPRFSMGKLSGRNLSFGPISDVLLATTYEFGENDQKNYLIGPGFDLNLPGFDYFPLNFQYRKPDDKGAMKRSISMWEWNGYWSDKYGV